MKVRSPQGPARNVSASTGSIGSVTSVSVFSVLIVATPLRTCWRPNLTASPRLNQMYSSTSSQTRCRVPMGQRCLYAATSSSVHTGMPAFLGRTGSATPAVGFVLTSCVSVAHRKSPRVVSRKCRAWAGVACLRSRPAMIVARVICAYASLPADLITCASMASRCCRVARDRSGHAGVSR